MLVHELIARLKDMPANASVTIMEGDNDLRHPNPEQVWNDHAENFLVVL